jgi:hypothetical protein
MELFFVVNQADRKRKQRYVSQDNYTEACKEAIRLSKKFPEQEFTIFEAKPIGKMMDGVATHLDNSKA